MGWKEEIDFLFPFLRRRKQRRRLFDALWRGIAEKERDWRRIVLYHEYVKGEGLIDAVDDDTWRDLDLKRLYGRMDQTLTPMGQQMLYHRLRGFRCGGKGEIDNHHRRLQWIANHPDKRERIWRWLFPLRHEESHSLSSLLFDPLPGKPPLLNLARITGTGAFGMTGAVFFIPTLFLPLLVLVVFNIGLYLSFQRKVGPNLSAVKSLFHMVNLAKKIGESKDLSGFPGVGFFKKQRSLTRKISRGPGILYVDPAQSDDLSTIFSFYLNFICLWNIFVFFRICARIQENRPQLKILFAKTGELDADIALASWLKTHPHYCVPVFHDKRDMEFKNMFHPLLEDPVANDFCLNGESILITGSNMSGKTTFVKTVGVNIVLGRTLGYCLAEEARIPKIRVQSMIQREDDLEKGRSYYFTEVQRVGEMVERSRNHPDFLFLLDEPFRGTNTLERISATRAVLEYLARQNICLATTHDIELQDLLKKQYRMVHFSEVIRKGQYTFDYRIKEGPCRSRNAIKLLEITGYPKEVIRKSLETVHDLEGLNPEVD